MAIAEGDIERVRLETDFVAVASEHIALKRTGRRWTGLCPFHAEKSPSFSVNAEAGLYYCFGCQAKGDVISFVREIEHLDFVEAVEKLAARSGIELHYDKSTQGTDRKKKDKLIEVVGKAVEFYHDRLMSAPDAAEARSYLRKRGFDSETVKEFQIGWAPDDWDQLAKKLKADNTVLEESGLGFVNKRSRQQDAFRARIMFPIFDSAGKPVAFGGRKLEGGDGPKYKNSPETPIYQKRRILYGLNWAKTSIVESEFAVICEGYTDVIGFHRTGITQAVATCGTALAEEHVRALNNFARRIVLAYDADAAGQAAAERFYEWEQRYEMDIAVAVMPPGKDPGELAQNAPEELRKAVDNAQPFLAFRIDRVLKAADYRSPEGRARAADEVLAVISEHPHQLVRDQYIMTAADKLRIPADNLRDRLSGGSRRKPVVSGKRERPQTKSSGPETEALRVAIHAPEVFASFFKNVSDAQVLFGDELNQRVFRALIEHDDLHSAISDADPESSALLQRLAVEEPEEVPVDVLARLVDRAASRYLTELERAAREPDADIEDLSATTAWLRIQIDALRQDGLHPDTVEDLLRWFVSREGTTANA